MIYEIELRGNGDAVYSQIRRSARYRGEPYIVVMMAMTPEARKLALLVESPAEI